MQDNWISVEDELPELSELVLAYDPTSVLKYVVCAYLPLNTADKAAGFLDGMQILFNVTHFKHLSPPKPSQP